MALEYDDIDCSHARPDTEVICKFSAVYNKIGVCSEHLLQVAGLHLTM